MNEKAHPKQNILHEDIWNNLVKFHGHACPGLAIGVAACLEATRALELPVEWNEPSIKTPLSLDEELLCIAETDACSVDAFQFLLSCTLGKGNLFLRLRGKHAYTFMHRPTQKAVRLVANMDKEKAHFKDREALIAHLISGESSIFTVTHIPYNPPKKARIFRSYPCSSCQEMTAESMIRLHGEEKLCLDCYEDFSRIL